jgi:hypothetical protein
MSLGSGPRRLESAYALIFKGLKTARYWVMVSDVSKERNAFIFKGLEKPRQGIIDSRLFEDTA